MDSVISPALPSNRVGDLKTLVQLVHRLDAVSTQSCEETVARQRQMVAQLCRLLGSHLTGETLHGSSRQQSVGHLDMEHADLPPRVRQTLGRLLAGDSEKQIAARMGLSPHTVHCYVKTLYRSFEVSSRGELLSRFVMSNSPHQVHA